MGEPPLRRSVGLFDATMLGLGAIIGAGVFVAIGVAAGSAGALLPLAILLAAIPASFNGLSAAANAIVYPQSGGTYLSARQLLSPFFGFLAGWLFIFATIVGDTAIALGFGAYVNSVFPALPVRLVGLALVFVAAAVNFVGVEVVTRANNVFSIVKIGVLALFVTVGGVLLFGGAVPRAVSFGASPSGVLAAAALLFFAYPGYARVTTMAEEIRYPTRNIPRAIVLALAIAAVLYVLTTLVAVLLVGPATLASSSAPLVAAASSIGASWLVGLVAIGGVVATSSVLLIDVTALSRMVLAMARNGDLPSFFTRINPRFATPERAVIASSAVIAILTLIADLTALIAAASFALLMYYVLTNASALRLTAGRRSVPIVVPVLGLLSCLGLAAFLPTPTIVLGLAILATGAGARGLKRLAHKLNR